MKETITELKKPKKTTKSYYDYFQVRDYLQKKYNKKFDVFWDRIMCGRHEVMNDSYVILYGYEDEADYLRDSEDAEALEELKIIYDEFSDLEEFWVCW